MTYNRLPRSSFQILSQCLSCTRFESYQVTKSWFMSWFTWFSSPPALTRWSKSLKGKIENSAEEERRPDITHANDPKVWSIWLSFYMIVLLKRWPVSLKSLVIVSGKITEIIKGTKTLQDLCPPYGKSVKEATL